MRSSGIRKLEVYYIDAYIIYVLIGKRPFGVSLLYAGWDQHFGYQLYQSDPSGNYTGWKATCIGNNHQVGIYYILILLYVGGGVSAQTGVQESQYVGGEAFGDEGLV
jgi:hypothetical protein